jgi:hypothetical protein
MFFNTLVGAQNLQDGAQPIARAGKQADTIVSELHGRFYEQNYRGNVYGGPLTSTSLANATFTVANGTSATLATAAASTPILGLYNPASSSVNAVILQASLFSAITALQTTGMGGLIWCVSLGNSAISTGSAPFGRKSLAQAGSQCKNMSGVALTGLSNLLSAFAGSSLNSGGLSTATLQTAAGLMPTISGSVENFDGSIIVPPGGVLALYATVQAVAISGSGTLLWEEVPV